MAIIVRNRSISLLVRLTTVCLLSIIVPLNNNESTRQGSLLAAFQMGIARTRITTSPGYSILYWLSYAGVYWNVGGVLSLLVFMKYTRNLASSARSLLTDSKSWPYLVSQGRPLPGDVLSIPSRDRDFTLMIHFGLADIMLPVWKVSSYAFYIGTGILFLNLVLSVWLI